MNVLSIHREGKEIILGSDSYEAHMKDGSARRIGRYFRRAAGQNDGYLTYID